MNALIKIYINREGKPIHELTNERSHEIENK